MKLENMFPMTTKAQKDFILNVLLSSFQAILSASEEELMEFIICNTTEEQINCFPDVKAKIKEYRNVLVQFV